VRVLDFFRHFGHQRSGGGTFRNLSVAKTATGLDVSKIIRLRKDVASRNYMTERRALACVCTLRTKQAMTSAANGDVDRE